MLKGTIRTKGRILEAMRLGCQQRVAGAGGGSNRSGRRIVSISASLTLTAVGFPEGNPAHIRTVPKLQESKKVHNNKIADARLLPAFVTPDGHILGHCKRPRRSVMGKCLHFVR